MLTFLVLESVSSCPVPIQWAQYRTAEIFVNLSICQQSHLCFPSGIYDKPFIGCGGPVMMTNRRAQLVDRVFSREKCESELLASHTNVCKQHNLKWVV